jgi:hypothetical protein
MYSRLPCKDFSSTTRPISPPALCLYSVTMFFSTLLFAASAAALPKALESRQGGQNTMLRFGCSQVIIDRIDPLVNPGLAPSPHMHQVQS